MNTSERRPLITEDVYRILLGYGGNPLPVLCELDPYHLLHKAEEFVKFTSCAIDIHYAHLEKVEFLGFEAFLQKVLMDKHSELLDVPVKCLTFNHHNMVSLAMLEEITVDKNDLLCRSSRPVEQSVRQALGAITLGRWYGMSDVMSSSYCAERLPPEPLKDKHE